jgi:regulator of cell morphogenesis and NO signaling
LNALLEKVVSVHGKNHPELNNLRAVFHGLAQELSLHMMKEEKILFPYIVRLEEAVIQKEPILPSPFGSVQNPVAMMEHEHEDALEELRGLRELSANFTAPADACVSYRALYQALSELAADLCQHIHLENDFLFPRAVAMEGTRR